MTLTLTDLEPSEVKRAARDLVTVVSEALS